MLASNCVPRGQELVRIGREDEMEQLRGRWVLRYPAEKIEIQLLLVHHELVHAVGLLMVVRMWFLMEEMVYEVLSMMVDLWLAHLLHSW